MARRPGSTAGTYALGVVVLAVVLGIFALALTASHGLPFVKTTVVRAEFTDTHSLRSGDQVRRFSNRIGKVDSVEYRDGHALVTMKLDGGDYPVYADASAAIFDFSALAQKFVELNVGHPAAGPLGDTIIPVSRTVKSADIYELLNVFDEPTRAQFTSALRQLGGGAAGHGPDLHALVATAPDLLGDLGTVSDAIAANDTNLPALLRNTNRVASRFINRRGDIQALVRGLGSTMQALSVDGAKPLSATLQKLPSTLDTAQTAFTALNAPLGNTQSAFTSLRPGFQGLGQATPDVRGVFREALQPLDKVPGVSDDAKPAVDSLTKTASDARPLARPLVEFIDDLARPIDYLAPYSPETGQLFVRLNSFVSQSVAPGIHYARASANFGAASAFGQAIKDQFTIPRNRYPAPGQSSRDRAKGFRGN